MSQASVNDLVQEIQHLTPAQKREVLSRLWPEVKVQGVQWLVLGEGVEAESYTPTQASHVEIVRHLLRLGVPARLKHEADGNWELYGPDRTYLVTIDRITRFAGLLSSWPPDRPPSNGRFTGTLVRLREAEVRRLVAHLRARVSPGELAEIEDTLCSEEGADYLRRRVLLQYFPSIEVVLAISVLRWLVRITSHAHLSIGAARRYRRRDSDHLHGLRGTMLSDG